jgi:hypothetical protein
VLKKALDKELFAECYIFDTRQRNSLPSVLLPRAPIIRSYLSNFHP